MSSIEHLVPDVLSGEITVKDAMSGKNLDFADGGQFLMELFQAMLEHWRVAAPSPPIDSPIVYVVIEAVSDHPFRTECRGIFSTYERAEGAAQKLRGRCMINKMIVDPPPQPGVTK